MDDLYEFRDCFFETHPIEKACHKRDMVEERMTHVLDEIAKLSGILLVAKAIVLTFLSEVIFQLPKRPKHLIMSRRRTPEVLSSPTSGVEPSTYYLTTAPKPNRCCRSLSN